MSTKKFKAVSTKKVKTYSIKKRKSKVSASALSLPHSSGGSFNGFLDSLPDVLAAKNLKAVSSAVIKAHQSGKVIALGIGAHVIKTGLSPLIIDLMERGIVSSISMNGACVIHDFELAYAGQTSEDVASELKTGKFGMSEETGKFINNAITKGAKKGFGIGRSVGEMIEASNFANKNLSILGAAKRLGLATTVHVAIGTDIIHMHPSMDGSATGKASEVDFRLLTSVVGALEGGVFINIGSAVIVPEVFLKALSLARNLKYKVNKFTTVNMDFIQHYRPAMNIVSRPTMTGGKGYALTGHHEIMVPLLFGAIIEGLGD